MQATEPHGVAIQRLLREGTILTELRRYYK